MKATGHLVARGLGGTTDRGTAGEEEGEDDEARRAPLFYLLADSYDVDDYDVNTIRYIFLRTGINSTLLFNYFMSPKQ